LFKQAEYRALAVVACVLGAVALSGVGSFGGWLGITDKWIHKADYSHGFLVVPFALYLVYRSRKLLPASIYWPSWAGVPLVAGALGLFYIETKLNVAMEWIQGASILVAVVGLWLTFLTPTGDDPPDGQHHHHRRRRPRHSFGLGSLGTALSLIPVPFAVLQWLAPKLLVQALPGGNYTLALYGLFAALLAGAAMVSAVHWHSTRVVLPALLMLALALPLPDSIESTVGFKLREFSTLVASYGFQLVGLPTHRPTSVLLNVNNVELSVEAACSGLSMLLAFVALCGAIVLLCPPSRSLGDRAMVFASAIPIAVLCNVLRIFLSGLVLVAGWQRAFEFIVHDFAGWAMMPVALGLIWLEFCVLDWLFTPVVYMSREEVAKAGFSEARAEIERAEAERVARQQATTSRTSRHAAPAERHPAAPFLPLTAAGTSHAATAAGGTISMEPLPPPQTPPPPPSPGPTGAAS